MIVACGEALIDLFPVDGSTTRWEARPGGSPLNVAIAAARLGIDAGFLGRVSTDRFGDLLREHIEFAARLTERDARAHGISDADKVASVVG